MNLWARQHRGSADRNDLVFQQAVEEEARERSRRSQHLTRQMEVLTIPKGK